MRRTLVLCEDAWHPAEIIRQGLLALAEPRFAFEFMTHGSGWSPAIMQCFPLVVVAKANHVCAKDENPWLTAETQFAIRNFVRQGGGVLFVHAGTCYKGLPEMRGVTGGAFLNHPGQCPVTVEAKTGHPLTAGVHSFTEKDEHYFMALDVTDADVFLHSRSEHGIQPAGWTRTEGVGRVCAATPRTLTLACGCIPEFQNLLRNVDWPGLLKSTDMIQIQNPHPARLPPRSDRLPDRR